MAAKRKLVTPHPQPEALQLRTLSGVYESARDVVRGFKVESTATYTQFAAQLKALAQPRNLDQMKALFHALDSLHKHSGQLGRTALIKPFDHPLIHTQRLSRGEE